MAVYIAAVRLSGGTGHQHISSFVWINEQTFKSGISGTAQMVEYLQAGGQVKVSDGKATALARVVEPQAGSPFLQTHADGKWTNNLLSLPRF